MAFIVTLAVTVDAESYEDAIKAQEELKDNLYDHSLVFDVVEVDVEEVEDPSEEV